MGLFDTVFLLDDAPGAACPAGHRLVELQTKDLDPAMMDYLVHDGSLLRVVRADDDAESRWRIEGDVAIRERRARLERVEGVRTIDAYGSCERCDPVLVRRDTAGIWGDLVEEHRLFVDLSLTFRPGEPVRIVRTSSTRDELKEELAKRGVWVLDDEDALAVAHRTVKAAREQAERPTRRRR